MTTPEDSTTPDRPVDGAGSTQHDPHVSSVEKERGGITDASLEPEADADVELPDPSLTDESAQAEGHPS